MEGSLTFLGTGTSMGVPTLGCGCAVCTSADPRDRRLRPSVLVRWNETAGTERTVQERVVVIDTGPDFREQALAQRRHARGRGVLYALARRPYTWPRRSAAAELQGVSRGRAHSALRDGGDGGDAGTDFRLHAFAACDLSDPRQAAPGAAQGNYTSASAWISCAFR
jgi:hypothetical protein